MSLDDRIEKLLTIPSHEQPTEDKNDAYQRLFNRAVLMLRRGASIVEADHDLDRDASRAGLDSMRIAQDARRTVEAVQRKAWSDAVQLAKSGSDFLTIRKHLMTLGFLAYDAEVVASRAIQTVGAKT